MKNILFITSLLFTISSYAQKDSSASTKQDTIKVGNMYIVKDGRTENTDKENLLIGIKVNSKNKRKNGVRVYSSIPEINDNSIKFNKDTLIAINDDTIKIGKFNVIKSQDPNYKKDWQTMFEDGDFEHTNISIQRTPKTLKPITTNWWILDLGFANLIDRTDPVMYTAIPNVYPGFTMPYYPTSNSLKLRNEKTSNVNLWVVQQKVNLYKHYWNLKYGIGIEMYNFRFEQPISFSNTPGNYVYYDNVTFKKNKLFVEYLSLPIQLNYQSNPQNKKSFYASLGMSAGYLIQSHTKQISEERGKKKVNGNFNLNNLKLATIGELGVGSIRLYGSYNLTNLFDENLTNFNMTPFAIGIRFSRF